MAKSIKVTDKLPKIGQAVLATDGNGWFIDVVASITETAEGKTATWEFTDEPVTHWQPLPALPEKS